MGDTFGLGLGVKADKHLIVWTPKETSEGDILPGFDSEDGELTVKMRARPGAWVSWIDEAQVTADALDDYDGYTKAYRNWNATHGKLRILLMVLLLISLFRTWENP